MRGLDGGRRGGAAGAGFAWWWDLSRLIRGRSTCPAPRPLGAGAQVGAGGEGDGVGDFKARVAAAVEGSGADGADWGGGRGVLERVVRGGDSDECRILVALGPGDGPRCVRRGDGRGVCADVQRGQRRK